MIASILGYIEGQPRSVLLVSGFIMVGLVGLMDHLTGPELYFSVFYLIPVFLVSWFATSWAGMMLSLASAMTWLIADFTSGATYSHPAIRYWNVSVRFVSFLVVTFLLTELKRQLEREQELARRDSLTGVANSRYFMEVSALEINRARRYRRSFSVVYIDLDNFKAVNDRFGHSTGNALLQSVANTIKDNIRSTDIVARMGGDEFTILLPEAGPEPAEAITHKVRKLSLDAFEKNGWPVTLSIGTVTFTTPPLTVDEMLKISDDAMYAAKSEGKNAIRFKVVGSPKDSLS